MLERRLHRFVWILAQRQSVAYTVNCPTQYKECMMAISIFDTHKFVRRMEAAGLTLEQAEAQADVLTEAFTVNLEALVTKEYLESRLEVRFAENQAYMDKRFAEQQTSVDTRFAEQYAYMDKRFAEQKAYTDSRFSELRSELVELRAQVDSNQRVFVWTQAIVVAAVLIPYLERMMAL